MIYNQLDYLFEDWFDFNNDLDNYFTGGSAAENDGIRNLSIAAVYAISNYVNNKTFSKYRIKDFDNNIIQSNFKIIRSFSNLKNSAFYKLGIVQTPPVRIIFKNFED